MSLLQHAEQAVLGACLLDPTQLVHLKQQRLKPEDFEKPIHRAIYQALLDLHDTKTPTTTTAWPTAVLAQARRYVRGLNTSYLYRVTGACPRPSHAPTYATIVREGATRRLLIQAATRLQQAAGEGALLRVIDAAEPLITQFQHHPPPPAIHRDPSAPPDPPPTDPEHVADELDLLTTLTHHPEGLRDIPWLHPTDFTNPTRAHLYQCLTALAHRGDPIDSLTLHWEMHRRQTLNGDASHHLDAIADHPTGSSPTFLADRLLTSSVLRAATRTAETIHTHATNEATPLRTVVRHAQQPLNYLATTIRRWQARHPTSGSRSRATSTAGPAPVTAHRHV
ncbi:DnaB-like helicase N-terminal domain-containing protein [Streptomyces triticirhizae]|uniref:DnaB-like helicase N-terminal domain-containing protein n=1 Tax=Streptomyces triticirhizae TaxID=2483353 RepID=UPI0013155A4E|nr:DnaB-like helicase N-terminal domain-containing protein [Streptomyces triticirhizae]